MRKYRTIVAPDGRSHAYRSWETQPRPYHTPLPYQTQIGTSSDPTVLNSHGTNWYSAAMAFEGSSMEQAALRRLWAKLAEQMGPKAENLTAIAEIKSTSDMIRSRVMQMINFAQVLRSRDPARFHRMLAVQSGKHRFSWREVRRDLSSLWLELWLGWLPSMGDIYATISVFDSNPHYDKMRVGTSVSDSKLIFREVDYQWQNYQSVKMNGAMVMGMEMRPWSNDVVLASSLGLTNPFLTAWDLVPLSFVWNWFNPVSAWLGQFSVLDGYSLKNGYLTRHVSSSGSYSVRFYGLTPNGYDWLDWGSTSGKAIASRREPGSGVPPYFKFPPIEPPRLNITRALTSIALLQGSLKSF